MGWAGHKASMRQEKPKHIFIRKTYRKKHLEDRGIDRILNGS
jgi:hypothetical protein